MYTKGPWRVDKNRNTIVSKSGNGIADGPGGFNENAKEYYGDYLIAESVFHPPNQALIAAAPELLEVLENLISLVEYMPMVDLTETRQLVAKAKGEKDD